MDEYERRKKSSDCGYMKIGDIPVEAKNDDFTLAYSTFLDDFYYHKESRMPLIQDEPVKGYLADDEYCILAATVHKLANDYGLPVPQWVMSEKYNMPYPVYAFNTSREEYQEFLRKTTPVEFKVRNLFMGSNVLSRA